MMYLAFGIIILVLIINLIILILWFSKFKVYDKCDQQPKVSVLIAARNEEAVIEECLIAVMLQNYPKSKLEILVGNDDSKDNTAEIVQRFDAVRLVNIKSTIGKAKGKANVLAYLANEATGDVFLITDADMKPNPSWVKTMVSYLSKDDIGIVNGSTAVENSLFQNYEWLYFQGMIKVNTDLWAPITAVGNNMLITRIAYEETGGYENIDFSITEDQALFLEVKKKGFKTITVIEEGVLAYTRPINGLLKLLQQRKRWMKGAIKLPIPLLMVLITMAVYLPALAWAGTIDPAAVIMIFITNVFITAILIKSIADKLGVPMKGGLLLYNIYGATMNFLSVIYYLLPVKVKWKERVYHD